MRLWLTFHDSLSDDCLGDKRESYARGLEASKQDVYTIRKQVLRRLKLIVFLHLRI